MLLRRDVVAGLLPHIIWNDQRTHILPFYSFAAVQREFPAVNTLKPAAQSTQQYAAGSARREPMQPTADVNS